MKKLLLSLLLLASCAPTVPRLLDPPALVYENQYIISAQGDWQPWTKGLRSSQIYPAGIFLIEESNGRISVQPSASGLSIQSVPSREVPYSKEEEEKVCKEIQTEGVSCSSNFVMKAYISPNDPLYRNQWQYQRMGSEKAWQKVNHTDVKVAVIDTGVSAHPDLNQSIKGGYNAVTNGSNFSDDNSHGSHCGGIVCAQSNNSLGVTGSAWSCNLYGVKFLQANGSGSLFDAIRAIDWSIQNGVRIISASWGGGGFSQPLFDAIQRARSADILFVAAAGNEGRNTDQVANYPSGYELDNVISVGSIDGNGKLSYFSNYGVNSVDLVAPGGAILSTNNSNGYVVLSGTSMAAPAVSGVAALIWQQDPNQTYLEVKQKLFANAKPRPKMKVKYGELQADSFDSTPCDPKKLKLCYDGCKATFPNQTYKRRVCRRSCREQFSCEVGALTWAKEQLGLD